MSRWMTHILVVNWQAATRQSGPGFGNKMPFVAAISLSAEGRPLYVKTAPIPGITRKALIRFLPACQPCSRNKSKRATTRTSVSGTQMNDWRPDARKSLLEINRYAPITTAVSYSKSYSLLLIAIYTSNCLARVNILMRVYSRGRLGSL